MLAPILFLCALAGAVLVQAFIRTLVAPRGLRMVPARRTSVAGRVEAGQGIGEWENEGGSIPPAIPRRHHTGSLR